MDLTLAAVRKLKFRKPDGTVLSKDASGGSASDGTKTAALGWMHYLSVANDLDVDGEWSQQGYVEIGGGKWSSDEFGFTVYPVFS